MNFNQFHLKEFQKLHIYKYKLKNTYNIYLILFFYVKKTIKQLFKLIIIYVFFVIFIIDTNSPYIILLSKTVYKLKDIHENTFIIGRSTFTSIIIIICNKSSLLNSKKHDSPLLEIIAL
jgi:hypothetical protein